MIFYLKVCRLKADNSKTEVRLGRRSTHHAPISQVTRRFQRTRREYTRCLRLYMCLQLRWWRLMFIRYSFARVTDRKLCYRFSIRCAPDAADEPLICPVIRVNECASIMMRMTKSNSCVSI